ncbi:uncharacterized protein LOC142979503 isoform X2 [Anticarsia gemmatalis]|uniref:uncharacterized protein LOC142979503 isoform X2 n=1 Tax=Anticarsia gemmatalis TaxID=129554 RepID=UPI003F75E23E
MQRHSHIHGDEDKIMKACYWANEMYEPCFGGCAEVSCDNPRNHLRPCYPYCEPGCICEDPYVRDDRTHQCVLPQDCSPTQMGIPVPTRRSDSKSGGAPAAGKYPNKQARGHNGGDFPDNDIAQNNLPMLANINREPVNANPNQKDDFKRGSEVSRMGNYFNIVIAPPPIKALQPRKLVQDDVYRNNPKRIS